MSFSSALALLISLASVLIYGYAIYYMNYNPNLRKMLTPVKMSSYGMIRFLTYHSLLIQFLSSILHVGAHFSRSLVKPRDLVFNCLAYPVGSIVVYSFWAVWHFLGRELIFPVALSQYYPDWLNHCTHSIVAPTNILLAILVNHRYSKNQFLVTLLYLVSYIAFLQYIKIDTGMSVYPYLDIMSEGQRYVYFAGTGLLAYLMYKLGQFTAGLSHESGSQRPAGIQKKVKQR